MSLSLVTFLSRISSSFAQSSATDNETLLSIAGLLQDIGSKSKGYYAKLIRSEDNDQQLEAAICKSKFIVRTRTHRRTLFIDYLSEYTLSQSAWILCHPEWSAETLIGRCLAWIGEKGWQ